MTLLVGKLMVISYVLAASCRKGVVYRYGMRVLRRVEEIGGVVAIGLP